MLLKPTHQNDNNKKLIQSKNVQSFPSHKAIERHWSLGFLRPRPDLSLHCETMDTGYSVPVQFPHLVGTHYVYPRKDGQAELTWVAYYIRRWFNRLMVTHSWVTLLMWPTPLTAKLGCHNSAKQITVNTRKAKLTQRGTRNSGACLKA